MRISDWSSDVCSSDLHRPHLPPRPRLREHRAQAVGAGREDPARRLSMQPAGRPSGIPLRRKLLFGMLALLVLYSGYAWYTGLAFRSEEHTSELQSLMRISYAVFCLKKKKKLTETRTKNLVEQQW